MVVVTVMNPVMVMDMVLIMVMVLVTGTVTVHSYSYSMASELVPPRSDSTPRCSPSPILALTATFGRQTCCAATGGYEMRRATDLRTYGRGAGPVFFCG